MFLRHPFHMFHLQPALSNCLFPIGIPTKTFHGCLISSTPLKWPVHSILLNSTILICGEECIIWRSSWCNFLKPPWYFYVTVLFSAFCSFGVLCVKQMNTKDAWGSKLANGSCWLHYGRYYHIRHVGVQQQQQQQPNSSVEHKTRSRPSVTERNELQWKGFSNVVLGESMLTAL